MRDAPPKYPLTPGETSSDLLLETPSPQKPRKEFGAIAAGSGEFPYTVLQRRGEDVLLSSRRVEASARAIELGQGLAIHGEFSEIAAQNLSQRRRTQEEIPSTLRLDQKA